MRYLRTNTATRITVGPFLDKTDGITPEVALTVTSEKLTFVVDTAGVPTLILDTAPTTAGVGVNDMVHITGDDSGYYDLELAAANVNYLGRAMLSLNDLATHLPVFHEFMILPAVIYDAMILGTDLFDVSMTQILGTAVSTPALAGILDINVKNIANAVVNTATAQVGANVVTQANIDFGVLQKASIGAEVDEALGTDPISEMAQGLPPITPTIKQALMYLYMALRDETNTTATLITVKNDAGTVICKATLSDNGTTFVKGEMVSGP